MKVKIPSKTIDACETSMKIIGPIPNHILKLMPPEDRASLGKAGKTAEEISVEQTAKSERQLQDNISRLLRIRGIAFFWQRMDRKTTGTVGWADFTFAVNGRACAFEVKLPGQKLTAGQSAMHTAMRSNGWTVWIIYNEGEAVEVLNKMQIEFEERPNVETCWCGAGCPDCDNEDFDDD